jgi:NhaP-type Na+/H+ or K+/H+ antiporter
VGVPTIAAAGALDEPLAVLGGLLVLGALLAGVARRSFVSLPALFVLAGFLLGEGGVGVLDFDPRSGFVEALAVVALIVILFRDGLEVEEEMLQTAWHLPLRKLVLAMPLTCVLVALAAHTLTDLSWTESFLLGALLSPTDPVLSSSVVTNPRVPRIVRHSLNLESGLNDGLALPAVLAFTSALAFDNDFVWWRFVIQDVTLGFAFGALVAWIAARLLPRDTGLGAGAGAQQKALYALGTAFACYGAATLLKGNGFIAVFVGSIVFGILRPDVRESFEARSVELLELVKLGVFVVFGSLFTLHELFADGAAAVTIVAFTLLLARPVAVFAALAGSRVVDTAQKGFMAWFGPKGVATMTFSLFVLGSAAPGSVRIANLAALAVFASVIAHGLTDTPGANWLARRPKSVGAHSAEPSASA